MSDKLFTKTQINDSLKDLTIKQCFYLIYWDLFYPKKRNYFFQKRIDGMSTYFAFKEAKNK